MDVDLVGRDAADVEILVGLPGIGLELPADEMQVGAAPSNVAPDSSDL
jgi:hypothetical protein